MSAYKTPGGGYYREELLGQGPPKMLPPDYPDRPAKRVQPFPVVELDREELVVPPREFGSLVEQPEPRFINV